VPGDPEPSIQAMLSFGVRPLLLSLISSLFVALALPVACRGKPKPTPSRGAAAATTSADIWLANLDGQIAELTRLTGERPEIVENVQRLAAAHHVRGRFRGDLDEIRLGVDLASKCLEREPESPTCLLMRAEQEQSLHRFPQAREDLSRARALGADAARADALAADLDWNDGQYERAIAAIRKARREHPTSATWLREAQLDHDLGDDAAADPAFDAATRAIADTSPLPYSHLEVQRGIVLAQRGKLDEACAFFRQAAERMPTYVAANEHLAEALQMLGRTDEAVGIYERVVKLTDDPEFAHALGVLYAARGRHAEARDLEARAKNRYEDLLTRYPEAMYWHASEFFLAIGDARRALELLEKNLLLRPNAASLVALARAELANGRLEEARTSIDRALAMPPRSAALFWTASKIYRRAGDAAAADRFRDRARALNPRIEADDPG
jgi:tetratricopeptide (TPR) repeat protein